MPTKRTRHSADFKGKVALDALKGLKTANEVASEYNIHPTQVSQWKKQLQDGIGEIFSARRVKEADKQDALLSSLYEEIGRLKVELEWLKKKSARVI